METHGSLPHSQVPPSVLILCHVDPVHAPNSSFLKVQVNIILPSTLRSPIQSLSIRFFHQHPVHASFLLICSTCPTHRILFYLITRTTLLAIMICVKFVWRTDMSVKWVLQVKRQQCCRNTFLQNMHYGPQFDSKLCLYCTDRQTDDQY